MQFEEFNNNVVKCIKFLNGDNEDLANNDYNDLCCNEESLFQMYQRDNKEAMTKLFEYTFSTDYFDDIELNMDVINSKPRFIQQIIAKNYILKHRENNEGRIKFLANCGENKEYIKYINTCEEYFELIDVLNEIIIKVRNPYLLFDKVIVDEIIAEVMDFKEPELDTKSKERWDTMKESVKNINENEMTEHEKHNMLNEIMISGLDVVSEALRNSINTPY